MPKTLFRPLSSSFAARQRQAGTINAVTAVATRLLKPPASRGVISARVTFLTERMVKNMMLLKLKSIVLVGVLAFCLCGITVAAVAQLSQPDKGSSTTAALKALPAKDEQTQPAKDAKPGKEMTEILKARAALAKEGYERVAKSFGEFKKVGNQFFC
jgi:hypothetical protein